MSPGEDGPRSRPTPGALLASPRGAVLSLQLLEDSFPAVAYDLVALAARGSDVALPAHVAEVVAEVAAEVSSWSDPLVVADLMDGVVSGSMGWQEPWEGDRAALLPVVQQTLRPIAAALLAAACSSWWARPVDLSALRVAYRHDLGEDPPVLSVPDTGAVLEEWRQDVAASDLKAAQRRAADPGASYHGRWWSHPEYGLLTTTRPVGTVGAVKLLWEEDSFGQQSARVWPVRSTRAVRVFEIGSLAAWLRLVASYPLEVTAERRDVWRAATGVDRRWFIPDWPAVAADWDGVHVSVDGWLTCATRLFELDGDRATVLAGWDPDETWWLTDCLQIDGDPVDWFNDQALAGTGYNWQPHPAGSSADEGLDS